MAVRIKRIIFIIPFIFLTYQSALSDQLFMHNGDVVSGRITGVKAENFIFDSAGYGTLEVPISNIKSLNTSNVVAVVFKEGGYATGVLYESGDGFVDLIGPNKSTARFKITEIKAIYPDGTVPAAQFRWKGQANLGIAVTQGNSENTDYNFDAEIIGRSEKDRITLLAEYHYGKSDGEETVNNQFGSAKYDRFLTKKWYLYGIGSGKRDKFQDLRLRTTIGTGAGYQFIETERTELSVEAGPSYVNEDFFDAPDDDYLSARWATNFNMWFFERFAQFFHNNEGFVRPENISDLLLRTRTGVRVPIKYGVTTTAQVNWDYDNAPAPGREKSDTQYILSIGYGW